MDASTLQKDTDAEKITCVFDNGEENKKLFCADWEEHETRRGHLKNKKNPCNNCPFRLHNFN